jgi:hypothetical protein
MPPPIDPSASTGLAQFFQSGPGAGILAGLGGFAGGIPNPASMQGSGTSTTNTSGEQNTNFNNSNFTQGATNFNQLMDMLSSLSGTTTTTPNVSPGMQGYIDKLMASYGNLTKPVDLSGYQASQTQGINKQADIASQSAANIMASRGLSTSPAAATTALNIDTNRLNEITKLNQSLPLLQNQLTNQNLGAASSFINQVPMGSTTTSNQQQQQQQQTAGGTSNVQGSTSAGTGYTSNQSSQHTEQNQNQRSSSGGGIGQAVGGIAGILASLFSDERLKEDIKPIDTNVVVDKIMQLRPVNWKWKGSEVEDTGLIAQDLKKVFPELVDKDAEGIHKVNYAGLIGTLVSAVQGIRNEARN